jgi:hypothetical protein
MLQARVWNTMAMFLDMPARSVFIAQWHTYTLPPKATIPPSIWELLAAQASEYETIIPKILDSAREIFNVITSEG